MRVSTLETIAGRLVEESIGVVRGSVMWSRGLKKFSRGGIRTLEYMNTAEVAEGLEKARAEAETIIVRHAEALGADAIVGLKVAIVELSVGMFQAVASGTAVRTSTLPVVARAFRQRGEATPLLAAANDTDAVIIPFPGLVRASLGGSVLFH